MLAREQLLDDKTLIDDIETKTLTGAMSDASATAEYRAYKALRNFSYRLRCEASFCKGNRTLLSEARETASLGLDDKIFCEFLEQAQRLGYIRVLHDVTADQTWVYA